MQPCHVPLHSCVGGVIGEPFKLAEVNFQAGCLLGHPSEALLRGLLSLLGREQSEEGSRQVGRTLLFCLVEESFLQIL